MAKTSTGVPGPGGPHLPTDRQAKTYSLQNAYISVSANLKLKDIYMLNIANIRGGVLEDVLGLEDRF